MEEVEFVTELMAKIEQNYPTFCRDFGMPDAAPARIMYYQNLILLFAMEDAFETEELEEIVVDLIRIRCNKVAEDYRRQMLKLLGL